MDETGVLSGTVNDSKAVSQELLELLEEMIDMCDSGDLEGNTTSVISIGWPSGTLTLRYTGIPTVSRESQDQIQSIMEQFSADCQMMLVWFVGTLNSREAIRHHLAQLAQRNEPLTINSLRPDGRVQSVFAQVPVEKVVDAFSDAGEFERLYAKAFVVFTFQIWEEVTRPKIATALEVEPRNVEAKLMGEWRHLRNWLIHRTEETKRDYFDKAKTLVQLLGSQPDEPNLTADKVFILMQHLNHMSVEVNPHAVEPGIEPATLDPGTIADIAKTLEPGEGMDIPAWVSMYPSAVYIISNGQTATIHELDCSYKDSHFQNLEGGRWLRVSSRGVASAVIKHLGKCEHSCEYCTAS